MMTPPRRVRAHRVAAVVTALGLSGALCATAAARRASRRRSRSPPAVPTYSSPIAMSVDGKLVWWVNPDDDRVSVIRTDQNTAVTKIKVGDEPQSVALDPAGRYAYVANTAGSSLTVIRITDARPGKFAAAKDAASAPRGPHHRRRAVERRRLARRQARLRRQQRPGHDHGARRRDAQARRPHRPAQEPLQRAGQGRSFQPRGMAVTGDSKKLYVTRFFSFVKPGGVQATDTGRVGEVCRLDIKTGAKGVGAISRPSGSSSGRRSPASRSTPPATRPPTTRRRSRTSSRAS